MDCLSRPDVGVGVVLCYPLKICFVKSLSPLSATVNWKIVIGSFVPGESRECLARSALVT